MKRLSLFLLLTFCLLSSCSHSQSKMLHENEMNENVLIVYLSRTKNTKAVAQMIQKNTGGKMVALELVTPYPANYQAIVNQVADENKNGFLPPLKTQIPELDKYEIIFIGFPTWGMQLPPPIKSFLSQNDLSGKTLIPFNTNAGYGVGSCFDTVKQLCPKSRILEGFSTQGGKERDGIFFVMEGNKKVLVEKEIEKWLRKIKVI